MCNIICDAARRRRINHPLTNRESEKTGGAPSMTHRIFAEEKLLIATHNKGKLREIRDLLAGRSIAVHSAGEMDLEEPDETETSFTGNAILKARAAATATGLVALADDSGLVVDALGGDPGIYSARWAGPDKDFAMAMQTVEDGLAAAGGDNRRAHFICALSLVWPDGHDETFVGRVDGNLTWPPRGDNGFGYDPIFIADGQTVTFGEMDPAKKHAMGHRADAFSQLMAACFTQ